MDPSQTSAPPAPPRDPRLTILLGLGLALILGVGGILGARLVADYNRMPLHVRRAEAPANVDGIHRAELAYHTMWGTFTSAGPTPTVDPVGQLTEFDSSGPSPWHALGWMPLSSVRCQYEVKHIPGATPETEDFKVTSRCDLDHDGEYAIFEASRAQTATRTTPEDVY